MVASTKLLHLLEAFSTPWFLFSAPTNHHLVFFLLEIFNNIIQVIRSQDAQLNVHLYNHTKYTIYFSQLYKIFKSVKKSVIYVALSFANFEKELIFSLLIL